MSVCAGAFVLASTGLLAGKPATTHHSSYKSLAIQFPDIRVQPGARFVEFGNIATAGGLTSGIDLALHVVERYFGRKVAEDTAYLLEYQGTGWTDPAATRHTSRRLYRATSTRCARFAAWKWIPRLRRPPCTRGKLIISAHRTTRSNLMPRRKNGSEDWGGSRVTVERRRRRFRSSIYRRLGQLRST